MEIIAMGFMQPPPVSSAHGVAPAAERRLNWLALGLLLAAWNAADDGLPRLARPAALQAYERVSVRAWMRTGALER